MEEARFSFNVKFMYQGFECGFTLREDQPGKAVELVDKAIQVISYMGTKGAVAKQGRQPAAERPAEVIQEKPKENIPPCPQCGSADQVELISFKRDGKPRQAYKCQVCQKWLK